jgi:hypothetical protein
MPDQSNIGNILHPHYANESVPVATDRELNAGRNLASEFLCLHVGIMKTLVRNDPTVSFRSLIDYFQNLIKVIWSVWRKLMCHKEIK